MSALIVVQFVGFYVKSADNDLQQTDSNYLGYYFELAIGGLLSVAEFARINGDWNFLLEKCLMLLAIDLKQHSRIAPGGVRRANPTFSTKRVLNQFFGRNRPYKEEADHFEWSCDECS